MEAEIFKKNPFKFDIEQKSFYETALLDKEKIRKIYTSRLPENALNIPMKSFYKNINLQNINTFSFFNIIFSVFIKKTN
jgi:hypothetical protein